MNNKRTCIGMGLVSLDRLILNGDEKNVSCRAGGTCGNVMIILSHMGWESYPIARLDISNNSEVILCNMSQHRVHLDYILTQERGKTPIITQWNYFNQQGLASHRFSFTGYKGGRFLDFSPVTKTDARSLLQKIQFVPNVFFFDRVSASSLFFAEHFIEKGTIVFFEPSVKKIDLQFMKCVKASNIIKFSEQRMPDISFAEQFPDKLYIQTLGSEGLRYKFPGSDWKHLPTIENSNIVDTAGAGDWTTAAFLNALPLEPFYKIESEKIEAALIEAQKIGALSCSYAGARGMMEEYD